ncbi:MAG TPA: hypothetical protein VF268_15310 [Gammaproteobacteria bacterium]
MNRKRLLITGSAFLLFMVIVIVYIQGQLPYYYQSRIFYLWKNEAMQDMADKFVSDSNIEEYSAGCTEQGCQARVRFKGMAADDKYEGDEADEYINLARESRLSIAWKFKGYVVFSLGSLSKFDKQFNIAYLYYPDGIQKYKDCKRKDYKTSISGQCDVRLSDNWSLNYHWINLDKYNESLGVQ